MPVFQTPLSCYEGYYFSANMSGARYGKNSSGTTEEREEGSVSLIRAWHRRYWEGDKMSGELVEE